MNTITKVFFLLLAVFTVSGCSTPFHAKVEAYDLLPRPLTGKSIAVKSPDDSIASRVYTQQIVTALRAKGMQVVNPPADLTLSFSLNGTAENTYSRQENVWGTVDYVVDEVSTSYKKGEEKTTYNYKPVQAVVGTQTVYDKYYFRRLGMTIGDRNNKPLLSVNMLSDTMIDSEPQVYTAMLTALFEKIDRPLTSGNYLCVIPPPER